MNKTINILALVVACSISPVFASSTDITHNGLTLTQQVQEVMHSVEQPILTAEQQKANALDPVLAQKLIDVVKASKYDSASYEEVLKLIYQNVNSSYQDENGMTALMYAAQNLDLSMVQLLIMSDSLVTMVTTKNPKDKYKSALEYAVQNTALAESLPQRKSDRDAIVALLQAEAPIEPLRQFVLKIKSFDTDGALALLSKNPNIAKMIDPLNGKNVVMVIVPFLTKKIIDALVQAGADLNLPDKDDKTVLMLAVKKDNLEIVNVLIAWGVKVNYQNTKGKTALALAASLGNLKIVEALIQANADVNIHGKAGWTSLMWAAYKGHVEIVTTLIKKGADIHARDEYGRTPLMVAALGNNVPVVDELIKAGSDVNAKSYKNQTALINAASEDNYDVVEALIKASADLNVQNVYGITALLFATMEGHFKVVGLLIKAGADVNLKDRHKQTALFRAVMDGNLEIVNALIQANADVNIQNVNEMTPLMSAARDGYVEIVNALLQAGANIHLLSNKNKDALNYAHEALSQAKKNNKPTKNWDEVIALLGQHYSVIAGNQEKKK